MKISSLALCFLVFSVLGMGYSWGFDGHKIIAKIAQEFLTPKAWNACQIYNGQGVSLESIAAVPDDYSHSGDGRWSSSLHYVNIAKEFDQYVHNRDCIADNCVVGAINNYTRIIRTKPPARWTLREPSPITFLVHFIADLHQPLHSGYRHDKGGNSVRVTLFGRSTNLHSVWDSGLIKNSGRTYQQLYQEVKAFINANPALVKTWTQTNHPNNIANESYTMVKRGTIYKFPAGGSLGKPYLDENWRHVVTRLAAGAVRLAHTLNQSFA